MQQNQTLAATSDEFKQSVQTFIESSVASDTLDQEAHALITTLAADAAYNRPLYGNQDLKGMEVAPILYWMLEFARPCGGDAGHRYAASAIRACQSDRSGDDEATMMQLSELAVYWFTDLLFFCEYSHVGHFAI